MDAIEQEDLGQMLDSMFLGVLLTSLAREGEGRGSSSARPLPLLTHPPFSSFGFVL